ncbi:MAG: hypothetical protein O3C21_03385 [Verrucomicrobia bacterium]|nr:hypothetical protein [Verrucomicrobiota bacterium]
MIDVPITLTGFWSQTYLPGHHNTTEAFLFEPQLDKGVSHAMLEALALKNIAVIVMELGTIDSPGIRYLGTDWGEFRNSP